MRSHTSSWFETKVRYGKLQEDGTEKKVTESFVVDAFSFTEAEDRITQETCAFVNGDFEVTAITKAPYKDVFFTDATKDDKWYKAKVAFITTDEKTGKEKKTNVVYLVQADNLNNAVKNIDTAMSGSMIDYISVNVTETAILDVYEHKS